MEILLFWLLLCAAVAVLASRYNRSGFAWFLLSLVLSPVIGAIIVLAAGARTPRQAKRDIIPSLRPGIQRVIGRAMGHSW